MRNIFRKNKELNKETDLSSKKDILAYSLGYRNKDFHNKGVYWLMNIYDRSKSYILINDNMDVVYLIEE